MKFGSYFNAEPAGFADGREFSLRSSALLDTESATIGIDAIDTVPDDTSTTATVSVDDTLDGGIGDDILTGGSGSDTFVFAGTWGDDTVTDFEDGLDLFDFSASGLNFADLTISQAASDTLIEDAFGNSITLQGITATDITADDFFFA